MRITPYLMTVGYLCLASGFGCYARYAMMAHESRNPFLLLTCFILLMASLLFFNLPGLLNRLKDRKAQQDDMPPSPEDED